MIDTQKLRQRILDLAIRGKLVPQDPNDEPASILLEKIRAEKERLIKEGKIKRSKAKQSSDKSHYEDLPYGWVEVNLGDLFSIGSAKRIMKTDWTNEGIPFYRTREVVKLNEFGVVDNELYISEEYYQEIKDKYGVPLTNDIMLTAVGTIGIPYIVRENDIFYYKDASVLCLANIHNLNSRFFYYLLQSTDMRKQMFGESKGTTVDTITINKAEDFVLRLPPSDEQERIVEKIDIWLGVIRNIKESKNNLVSFIDSMKSKVLDLAMQGKLVEQDPSDEPAADMLRRINSKAKIITDNPHSRNIPSNWCWVDVKSVFHPMRRRIPSGDVFHYIDIDSVDNKTNTIKPKLLRVTDAPSRAARETQKGDVVFSMVRPYLRNIAIVESNDCIASTGFYIFRPMEGIINGFAFLLLISDFFVNGINSFMKGDNSPSVNKDNIESFVIPLPPIKEQERIVSRVLALNKNFDNIEASLQS